MISFYILSVTYFPKLKGLSDAKTVSVTKHAYGFTIQFFQRSIKFSEIDFVVCYTHIFFREV